MSPSMPRATVLLKCSTVDSPSPRWVAAVRNASAMGCSLPCCNVAATWRTWFSVRSASNSISAIAGLPSVRVPVLSKTTCDKLCARSKVAMSLIKMPARAAAPEPVMIAVGVAKPKAQGQAMTNTATALMSACSIVSPAKLGGAKPIRSAR